MSMRKRYCAGGIAFNKGSIERRCLSGGSVSAWISLNGDLIETDGEYYLVNSRGANIPNTTGVDGNGIPNIYWLEDGTTKANTMGFDAGQTSQWIVDLGVIGIVEPVIYPITYISLNNGEVPEETPPAYTINDFNNSNGPDEPTILLNENGDDSGFTFIKSSDGPNGVWTSNFIENSCMSKYAMEDTWHVSSDYPYMAKKNITLPKGNYTIKLLGSGSSSHRTSRYSIYYNDEEHFKEIDTFENTTCLEWIIELTEITTIAVKWGQNSDNSGSALLNGISIQEIE